MKRGKILLVVMVCLVAMAAQAQVKVCMSYGDFMANRWKAYEDLIPGKEPDSVRVTYDGQDYSFKTADKECNSVIKKEVFMMSIDKQLFVNQRMLRDQDGVILPVNNYLRVLPYSGDKYLVVCYHATMGDALTLLNIGLDIALLATGHTTMGSIFLATDLLLGNSELMEKQVLYLMDKGPNEKGKILLTFVGDQFMEKLLRDDPVTFSTYYGAGSKSKRQSASNILPILVKKGLIQDYHHKK